MKLQFYPRVLTSQFLPSCIGEDSGPINPREYFVYTLYTEMKRSDCACLLSI